MYRARLGHRGSLGSVDKPVSRDAEYRFGPGQRLGHLTKTTHEVIFLRPHSWDCHAPQIIQA